MKPMLPTSGNISEVIELEPYKEILTSLAGEFNRHGEELYLVGGSVRDSLLGRLAGDLDFTTSALPDVTHDILSEWADAVWDTGIEYGTISAAKDGQQVEITTFRADTYDGTSRNPVVKFGDTLEGDLVRRDFTINAMAIALSPTGDHTFCDPLGGLTALQNRIIDTPDAPEISFGDDPLRMLRAARFAAQLEFDVATRVVDAMTTMAAEIDRITRERIQAELDKLICGAAPWRGIDLLVETGIMDRIFPEISALKALGDEHNQHKDVYQHSLTVLRQAMEQEEDGPDLVLRWAALLHDIGKPQTKRVLDNGQVTFHQHDVVGAKMARKRLRALKYSKQDIKDISQLIYLHMRFYGFPEGEWTDSAVRRYVTDAGSLLPRLHKLVRADTTTRNKKKARWISRAYDDLEQRIAELAEKEDLARVRPDLDGNEIMEILGITPGPAVGKAWTFMKELRLDRGPLPHDEAVAALKKWWKEQQ
ncbi:CCA tRNA nucleotidyltransferase [Corynebacterium glucuronolyticum]